MTMYRPNVGDVLLKKYEILSLVGEGAFGCVYRASWRLSLSTPRIAF